ncbi:MAG: nucleoside deaminase, partial [Alphaproteobacteria bacterium]|nr:nucleoside deaminase [Alphaproteobacteria bacterium]
MIKSGYMDQALDQARAAAQRGEVPVGAVLVDSQTGDVLAAAG